MRISEEHGVNPSISQCFYCGEDDKIILTGKDGEKMALDMGHEDGQMPMHCGVIDMEPCTKCRDYMKEGIIIIGMKDGEDPNKDINVYRTGQFYVVKDGLFKALKEGAPEETVKIIDGILYNRWTFMEESVLKALGLMDEDGNVTQGVENEHKKD